MANEKVFNCTSCKKHIRACDNFVSFHCPNCGKELIIRCKNCRDGGVRYTCPSQECKFSGP